VGVSEPERHLPEVLGRLQHGQSAGVTTMSPAT
jgi:hypothetical protein